MLIVNPNNRSPAPFSAIEPPLWAGLVASYYEAPILDAEAEDLTLDQTVERIHQWNGNQILIVVMGNNPSVSSTPKMVVAEALAEKLVGKCHVALTGIHPIAVGSRFHVMKINPDFPQGTGFPKQPWHKLPMHLYRAHNWHCLDDVDKRSPYASIYTSLGCPFKCSYCNIHALYDGKCKVQFRPLKDILCDFDKLADDYGVRNIKIWDELFTLKEDRVLTICDYIKGYDLNIWAYARLDTVTGRMLKAMKAGGINWLAYGFESSTDKKFTKAEEAIKMTRDAGINIMANFMFGLPGETEDNWKASLDFAVKQNFEYVNFYVALPYPGSQWYADLKDKPTDWSRFGQYSPNMYGDPKAIKFRDEAFRMYFRRPEYLSMIRAKFGEKAEAHIKEMVAWKIR